MLPHQLLLRDGGCRYPDRHPTREASKPSSQEGKDIVTMHCVVLTAA